MQKSTLGWGALLGAVTSLPVIALLFLGEQFARLPFVPFDLFDWLARVLPGGLITFGIDALVGVVQTLNLGPTDTSAKLAEQLMALLMAVAGGAVLGLVIALIRQRSRWPALSAGAGVGLLAWLAITAIEFNLGLSGNVALSLAWLAVIFVGWGALLGYGVGPETAPAATAADSTPTDRRAALLKIGGGSVAVALAAWGLGSLLKEQETTSGAGQPLANLAESTSTSTPSATPTSPPTATSTVAPTSTSPAAASAAETTAPAPSPTPSPSPSPTPTEAATLRDQVPPAPGTRPELTPNEDFYRIDINTRPTVIQGDSWVLEVEGLFDNPRPLTLEDLMAFPAVTQAITLSCISNPIAGDLIGTSRWTGARLRDVLKELGFRSEAKELYIEAEDGFFESVAMEDLMDPRTLLVYGMNGKTLPVEHGFPLRIYIPNRYGMKQPKWITRIEAIDEEGPGYWVERGWSPEARPRIISVIDAVADEADEAVEEGQIPVGGIAWAGDRGIEKVEVRVDDGEWREAILRTPPLSGLTWVQWRYDWPAKAGTHTFTVRATDGTGALQIAEEHGVRPDGATGYHSVTRSV